MIITRKYRGSLLANALLACTLLGGLFVYVGCVPETTNAGAPSASESNSPAAGKAENNTPSKPKSLKGTSKMSKLDLPFNELSETEAEVLLRKGTERAWTGEYTENKRKGTYICRRCNAPLYKSDTKFDSHCGWPSFDDEIKGAVTRHPDADGRRTEIVCENCEGHLGHVFLNEGFTAKNTRHCVNSISMRFIEEGKELPKVIRHDDKSDLPVKEVQKK